MDYVGLLRGADVVNDGAGGDGGRGVTGESEAFKRSAAKLALEQRDGKVGGEDVVVDRGNES